MRDEVSAVAREELGNALLRGGHATEAAKSMKSRAENDPVLYRQLMDPLLGEACHEAIRQACREPDRSMEAYKQVTEKLVEHFRAKQQ
jgi:hypothetical protein